MPRPQPPKAGSEKTFLIVALAALLLITVLVVVYFVLGRK